MSCAKLTLPVLFLVGTILTGCSSRSTDAPFERAPVMGTVTLDGELLEAGVVRFIPTDGTTGPQTTAVVERGLFTLPADFGPVVGTHRVEIESLDTGGLAMDDEQAFVRLQSGELMPEVDIVRIPPAYNERSKLIVTVPESGTSELNFELASN